MGFGKGIGHGGVHGVVASEADADGPAALRGAGVCVCTVDRSRMVHGDVLGLGVEADNAGRSNLSVVIGHVDTLGTGQSHRGDEHVRPVSGAVEVGSGDEADGPGFSCHRVKSIPGCTHQVTVEMEVGHVLVERRAFVGARLFYEHAVLVEPHPVAAQQPRHDRSSGERTAKSRNSG